jgi:alpha-glucosidase
LRIFPGSVDISEGSSSDGYSAATILAPQRLYSARAMWWQDAVVYQIYPRSFQDSDGDGVGDLRGISQRLDYLAWLGVDAFWLSPIYPSPLADFGYDVSDYTAVDPQLGSLEAFDALVAGAHERGLRVLLDLIPSHTSIEHPWFREHPDWYIWSPVDGPANNWVTAFGGSAWTRDERSGRWYLHSFYPEQADLDWRNPEVVGALQGVVRFWLDRGVDGFRADAIDRMVKDAELRDEPPATSPFPLPLHPEAAVLDRRHSVGQPEVIDALKTIREAAGDALLVGEVFAPASECARYLEVLDLVFSFELLFAPWDADRLRAAIEPAAELGGFAWVMSNHDFDRLATRVGPENLRAAAVLLLTLPGAAFVYQGDEVGQPNGPGADPPYDRAGRDGLRHPLAWDASPTGGFTTGTPWLAALDPSERNVESQRDDPSSLLSLYRRLIELHPSFGKGFRLLDAEPGVVAFERGEHVVAVNTTAEQKGAPAGEPVLTTHEGPGLPPHAAQIVRK